MARLCRIILLPLLLLLYSVLAVLAAPASLTHIPPGAGNNSTIIHQVFAANATHGAVIPDRYIVTLRSGLSKRHVDSHLAWVDGVHRRNGEGAAASTLAGISKTYTMTRWRGYAGEFDNQTLAAILANPDVAAVEPDRVWTVSATATQAPAPWGLGTLSHRAPATDYVYNADSGLGTFAYVVDTGLNSEHVEFAGGRAQLGYNAVEGTTFGDALGHGTHVAGTLAGASFGVARRATVVAVKVFGQDSSATSVIMDGYQWAVQDVIRRGRAGRAVINMSVGGDRSDAFNSLVNEAGTMNDIVTVVAAGNDGQDAAGFSPSSARGAITVGAVDAGWHVAGFSNYGGVVDVFGPGVGVQSAWIGSATASAVMSGTSMACPHVAGLVLQLMSVEGVSGVRAMTERVLAMATAGRIAGLTGVRAGTANRIVYNGSGM